MEQTGPAPTTAVDDPWFNTTTAAEALFVSTRTMRRYLANGIPGAEKDALSGVWRIPRGWVDAELARRASGGEVDEIDLRESADPSGIDLADPEIAEGLSAFLSRLLDSNEQRVDAEVRAARFEADAPAIQAQAEAEALREILLHRTRDLEWERAEGQRREADLTAASTELGAARERQAELEQSVRRANSATDEMVARHLDTQSRLNAEIASLQARYDEALMALGVVGRFRLRRQRRADHTGN